jgi:predicted site-specific integrase-resolvase
VLSLGVHTDVATAASVLGMGRSMAYKLIRAGRFPVPVFQFGRRIVVPVAGLQSMLGLIPAATQRSTS